VAVDDTLFTVISGALGHTRVYHDMAPQEEGLPCVVISKSAGPRIYSLDGYSNLSRSRYTITEYAATKATALTTMATIAAALDCYRGAEIQTTHRINEFGHRDWETKLYWIKTDYRVWHRE
jgi:hypothetical protein